MPSTNTALKTLETLKRLRLCSDSHNFQGSGEERAQGESSLPASSPAGVDTPLPSPNRRHQYYHAHGQSDAEDALFMQYILLLNGKCHEVSVQEESLKEVLNVSKGLRPPHV